MSLFVEVTSVEKKCPIIINLDHITEIVPLTTGGCLLFMTDGAGMNSRTAISVEEGYSLFKQFAMQTVTSEDIQKRIDAITPKGNKKPAPKSGVDFDDIPKL